MTKNGKVAGYILMATPTTSTSNIGHYSPMFHHVNESHLEHARQNNGEYEIDAPHEQEAALGKEYVVPQEVKIHKRYKEYARGGRVSGDVEIEDHLAFPERSLTAQLHHAHKGLHEDWEDNHHLRLHRSMSSKRMATGGKVGHGKTVVHKNFDTMRYEMTMKRGK
jgi:hypothetical protein